MIREAERHCWRCLMLRVRRQCLMRSAEIVERDIERDGGNVVFQLLAETVRQSGETPARHADRKLPRSA